MSLKTPKNRRIAGLSPFCFASILFLVLFFFTSGQTVEGKDDLRPVLKNAKTFVTQLSGDWRVFRTFTSSKHEIDICWENKENIDDAIYFHIEAHPDLEKADKGFADRERFLTFEETEEKTIEIYDFGDKGVYSFLKRFPNYLDHKISLRFRKGRFVVYINAPSDKIASSLARFAVKELEKR